jgi:hypothetical protein
MIAKVTTTGRLQVQFLADQEVSLAAMVVAMAALLRADRGSQPVAAAYVKWDVFSEPALMRRTDTEAAVLLASCLREGVTVEYVPSTRRALQTWMDTLKGDRAAFARAGFVDHLAFVALF